MQDKDILFENLINEYIAGSITDGDRATLFALIEESDTYKSRYKEMVKLYALLHIPAFEAQKESKYLHLKDKLHATTRKTSGHRLLMYARNIAAAILLMLMVSVGSIYTYNKLDRTGEQLFNETTVPWGSQTKITLPDGSVAVLNSGSILKYPLSYGKKERNVYLVGEGYFEVAKDTERIFQVYTEDMKIEVTGTVFNIRSYPEDQYAEVSLIDGGVNVSASEKLIRLKPDEKAIFNRTTGQLYSQNVESYKSALWTTGWLSFVNSSFTDIMKDIERKYNVKIHVESNKAEQEFFSGSINLEMSLQEVFNFIDVDKKYNFEVNGNTIILKDR